jgi:prohibitin 2
MTNFVRNVDFPKVTLPKSGIRLIAVIVLFLLLVFKTFIFIPVGYAGVVYDRGRGVLQHSLREGINIVIPFWQTVYLMDTRLQEYTMSAAIDEGALRKDDSLDAPTSDGQQVKIDASVLFRIKPEDTPNVYESIGPNYVDKVIRPFSRSQIRMVISRYSATQIYSEKRQEAEDVMTKEISKLLGDKRVSVDKVLLRAVNFSTQYSKALEDKAVAEQHIKQAEFEVQEAKQRADAKVAEAKGLAEAQNLQRASLTQEYLQLEAIKKWDGKLPNAVGSTTLPFLNLPTTR